MAVLTSNVVPIESELSWDDLAAIPESYATAWTCLHGNLAFATGHTLVIRGGFLGGLAPIASFNPLLQMQIGTHFSFFGSFVFGTPQYPLSDVPLQTIVDRVAAGSYQAKPVAVFPFEEIQAAHQLMESSQANGKIVVRIEQHSQ